jgi:hypothetical protein
MAVTETTTEAGDLQERNEFTERCLLSMADDVAKAVEHASRVQTMYWALAQRYGIKVAA